MVRVTKEKGGKRKLSLNKTKKGFKKIKKVQKNVNKYDSMSVKEFLTKDFDNSDSENNSEKSDDLFEKNGNNSDSEAIDTSGAEDGEQSDGNEDKINGQPDNSDSEDDVEGHKQSLAKLKETDPEFYKFLQENDKKLLQFNLSDDDGSDNEKGEDVEDVSDSLHKASTELEVASDESDFEDDDKEKDVSGVQNVTLKMLKTLQSDIKTDTTNKTINTLAQLFHAALLRISSGEKEEVQSSHFRVEGSSVFNAVIQLCVLEFGPAVRKFLGLAPGSKQLPHKCKRFVKIKKTLKSYFTDLLKLFTGVTSANIQTVLLKHLHYMSSMLMSFPNTAKLLVKRLIHLWGTAEDGVRVVAFFCILRITHQQQPTLLDTVLKAMYMSYVKNSKFVSLTTLASINFMRRSLVEMFALDLNFAYQHVFLYIRQLAIHLRNAITLNKKENTQTVYNWQYVNSLKLWANLLGATCNKPQLQQLIYPFVQVCLGAIRLVPTAQYYPLRFHITQTLIDFSRTSNVFIPILPFVLDVLNSYDFNKKHLKVSMKPLQFICTLRMSKSQLTENGFKDTLIDTIYGQLLEYLSDQSHTIAFPDLSLICIIQIKQFLKKCKNANYNRKMKQLIEKIEQNSNFIEKERSRITFNLTDFKQIDGFEAQIKSRGTPLSTYHESWSKIRSMKKTKELTNNEELGEYNLPVIKKHKKTFEKKGGPVELFPSDSEDDEDINIKRKRGKRGGKNINKKIVDASGPVEDNGQKDIVEDINVEDW